MSTEAPAPRSSTLRRSEDDRILAGVCSGIARQLGVDPLAVRVITVVIALAGGAGVLAYIIATLMIPAEGEKDPLLRKAIDGEDRMVVLGLGLIGIVAWAVVSDGWFLGIPHGWGVAWLLLAGAGVYFWLSRGDAKRDAEPPAAADLGVPSDPDAPTMVAGDPAPAAPRVRSSGRLALGVTLAGVAIVGAIGAIAGDGVRWDVLLACIVIGLGAALVVAAPFGGARALIPLGLFLAAITGLAAAADLDLSGGAGERVYRPETAAAIKSEYHLAAGRIELDLRDVAEFPAGTTKIKPEIGFGELVVRVPENARVAVDAHVGGGEIEALGHDQNGLDTDLDILAPAGAGPVIDIEARVGFGHIGIVRGDDPVGRHFRRSSVLGTFGGVR